MNQRDMGNYGLPAAQALYDPGYEHDACGMGFVVNIKGDRSHGIIEQALTVLQNLEHRGAKGAEENTGDGAGILFQIPDAYFRAECDGLEINLPGAGRYGVGMVFAHTDESVRAACESFFSAMAGEEGLSVLGWRDVPVDPSDLGESALSAMPRIRQVFVAPETAYAEQVDFERRLYALRKRVENGLTKAVPGGRMYFASLSSRTIVYKGMLSTDQLSVFYRDLSDPGIESALALVHSRFSTNTFPSWERAHPNRYTIHNGEINTLRGNVNWMHARQSMLKTDVFGGELSRLFPIIDEGGSDSAMFDNCLEFLSLTGRSLPHAVMMMIPEPWAKHETMSPRKRAFYQYHSFLMEPWDGPAAMGFTDGTMVGAVLDRNGLRPSRYYVTKDDMVILASEVGVLTVPPEKVVHKGRLEPGRMLLVDTHEGRIISDAELKEEIAGAYPYEQWVRKHLSELNHLPLRPSEDFTGDLLSFQKAFGYTYEELRLMLKPMAVDGQDPIGAMGIDTPLAVLSEKPQLLYDYFKQLFAQVTNPPIDPIRENIVMSTELLIGSEGNILEPEPEGCHQIRLEHPILTGEQMARIKDIGYNGFSSTVLPMVFDGTKGGAGLKEALDGLFARADKAIADGINILVLSDKMVDADHVPIPALLAVAGLHHHLIRRETRTNVGIVLESAEPRQVHHFCTLLGYGATAIYPYLAYETLHRMADEGLLGDLGYGIADKHYIKAAVKGILKVISKMGISTLQSYHGAQIFEAIGIKKEVIDRYFTWTASRIEGLGLDEIAREAILRHETAFGAKADGELPLDTGGAQQWRRDGEYHMYNPQTIHKLQNACRSGDYEQFKEFSGMIYGENQALCTLRGLLEFNTDGVTPVPIEEVESVESIVKRFKTGAMSYGSLSRQAHETLAIAMNRLGGKSNTGEGGEDTDRFTPDENGDSRCSAIKQVASGRFGVTAEYLTNAQEIQIKMAQGAKPGEGGQLPGRKVYPWVARVRHTTPGVGLISPPPHHDIYSIEDLAELIHDLKNANRDARISVKLVSEVGVGTVAAGVAKGRADVVLISGYDGGTGASPRTSIRNAGLPWELGLSETHQTLVMNRLRDRIVIETDGKLLTGRDVAIAALLGAEEYGFATAPLIVMGCIMMRVCNLNTCPVGVATQDPALCARFKGEPEHVVNFMRFIAQEMREIMASLGVRTVNEMIGRTELLKAKENGRHWKARGVDLSRILTKPAMPESVGRYRTKEQYHALEKSLDMRKLLDLCRPAIEVKQPVEASLPIQNTERVVGTILGNEITKRYGDTGLPEDTIRLHFRGSAGQSFGAFVPAGVTMTLEGDSNDYIGKGLSGGKVIVYPPKESTFPANENVVIGNVAFYGATGGEAYIRGAAGERFCVRNSGVSAVVEAVGDHGCEYMTGGKVLVLGLTGRNFAAGMSGGIAYVLDEREDFHKRCNHGMVSMERLTDYEEIDEVRAMIERHVGYTGSELGRRVLDEWETLQSLFVKVVPRDYQRMIETIEKAYNMGLSGEEAEMAAFEENYRDVARVSGN